MDNNTLASTIVAALAWPVTTIVVLALFRKELSALFGRIRKGQFGDATLEFEAAVAAVETIVQEKRGIKRAAHVPAETVDRSLARTDPRGAVITAWLILESEASDALRRKGLLDAESMRGPSNQALDELAKLSDLGAHDLMAFRQLQVMREKSVRSAAFQPSSASVLAYIALAKELGDKFKAID